MGDDSLFGLVWRVVVRKPTRHWICHLHLHTQRETLWLIRAIALLGEDDLVVQWHTHQHGVVVVNSMHML